MSPSVWSKKVHNSKRNRCKYVQNSEIFKSHKAFSNAKLEEFRNSKFHGPLLVTQNRPQQKPQDIMRLAMLVDSPVQCFPEQSESGVQTEAVNEEDFDQCDISKSNCTQRYNIAIQCDGQSSFGNGSVQYCYGRDCVNQQVETQEEYDTENVATQVTINLSCAPEGNQTTEVDENNNVVTNSPNELRSRTIDIENVAYRIECNNMNMQKRLPFECSSIYIINMKENTLPSEKRKPLEISEFQAPVCLPQIVNHRLTAKRLPSIPVMRRNPSSTKMFSC